MNDVIADAQAPSPEEFCAQLIPQLLADLDNLLFDTQQPTADAVLLLRNAAEAGAARGALWLLLIAAALQAHHQLTGDDDASAITIKPSEIDSVLLHLVPRAHAQLAALRAHAERLRHYIALAENAREPAESAIENAVVRLYQGLASGDDARAQRGLIELRSLVAYLDANAHAIDTQTTAGEPVRVVRPDRFHDYFLRFGELAQQPSGDTGERAVAALSRDGRISAVVTRDEHPLEAAERELRQHIGDDAAVQDASLLRIKALLAFIERLRRDPAGNRLLGNPLDDATAHSSLVVAAATAPLTIGAEFAFATLSQLALFNLSLLRAQTPATRAH